MDLSYKVQVPPSSDIVDCTPLSVLYICIYVQGRIHDFAQGEFSPIDMYLYINAYKLLFISFLNCLTICLYNIDRIFITGGCIRLSLKRQSPILSPQPAMQRQGNKHSLKNSQKLLYVRVLNVSYHYPYLG